MDFLLTPIAFIGVLGLLVFVHELGHFLAARMCGVGVYAFSIGFGPKIWGYTKGETEYKICAIPLGGYVQMVGQADDLSVDPRDQEMPDSVHFQKHPLRNRIFIVLAGPLMNLLFAYFAAPFMYWIGIEEEAWRSAAPEVGYVLPDSEADRAGIVQGALVQTIDGEPVANWLDVLVQAQLKQGEVLEIVAQQSGQTVTWLQPVAETDYLPDVLPIKFGMPAEIGQVVPGGAAEAAGLLEGDLIVQVDDTVIRQFPEIGPVLQARKGAPVRVQYEREGVRSFVDLTPQLHEDTGRYLIGIIRTEQTVVEKYGFVDGIGRGVERANEIIALSLTVIKKLFTGNASVQTLGGPVMIAKAAGDAASLGIEYVISFMMFISIQLGIMNLLPIPVLDGGHLLLFGIEGVMRRKPPEKVVEWATRFGLASLLLLTVFVTFNDIRRFVVPWVQTLFS